MKNDLKFELNRKVKGTKTFFFYTVNGRRITKTNYGRKYDAVAMLKWFKKKYTVKQINLMLAK